MTFFLFLIRLLNYLEKYGFYIPKEFRNKDLEPIAEQFKKLNLSSIAGFMKNFLVDFFVGILIISFVFMSITQTSRIYIIGEYSSIIFNPIYFYYSVIFVFTEMIIFSLINIIHIPFYKFKEVKENTKTVPKNPELHLKIRKNIGYLKKTRVGRYYIKNQKILNLLFILLSFLGFFLFLFLMMRFTPETNYKQFNFTINGIENYLKITEENCSNNSFEIYDVYFTDEKIISVPLYSLETLESLKTIEKVEKGDECFELETSETNLTAVLSVYETYNLNSEVPKEFFECKKTKFDGIILYSLYENKFQNISRYCFNECNRKLYYFIGKNREKIQIIILYLQPHENVNSWNSIEVISEGEDLVNTLKERIRLVDRNIEIFLTKKAFRKWDTTLFSRATEFIQGVLDEHFSCSYFQ
jgi:hypothetical protein